MRAATKVTIAAVVGLCFSAVGAIYQNEAPATTVDVQQTNPTITITRQDGDPTYLYNPDQLTAKAGETITITNNDPNGLHSVTADDRSFNVDVPPQGSATLTIETAGSYPYYCTYHPAAHNEASITVS